jgi:hypothetical protein
MKNILQTSVTVLGLLGLVGCGGGGTASQTQSNQSPASLPATAATASWNAANSNGGHGVSALGTLTGNMRLAQSVGSNQSASPLNIDDGYFFSSSGFSGNNAAESGGNGLVARVSLPSNYGQGFLYEGFRGNQSVFLGVYGNAPNSVPTAGSATWNGDAVARHQSGAGSVSLSGSARVNADFSSGTANVVMSGFSGSSFNQISISDMTISGSRFEGGNLQTLSNGTAVNIVGSGASASSSGVFLGSGSGIPDEVGGIFVVDGNSGTIAGAYMAD